MSSERNPLPNLWEPLTDNAHYLGPNRLAISTYLGNEFAERLEGPEPILPTLSLDEQNKAGKAASCLGAYLSGKTKKPPPPIWLTGPKREETAATVVRLVNAPNIEILGANIEKEIPPSRISPTIREKLGFQLGLPSEQRTSSAIGDRLVGRERSFIIIIILSQGENNEKRVKATHSAIKKLRKDRSLRQVPILVVADQEPLRPKSLFKKKFQQIIKPLTTSLRK